MKKFKITINDQTYDIDIESVVNEIALVKVNDITYEVEIERIREKRSDEIGRGITRSTPETSLPPQRKMDIDRKPSTSSANDNSSAKIMAPLSGLIIDLVIKEGDRVKAGDTVIRMEAMKMENDITSHRDGVVKKIMVAKGMEVREGEVLLEFGPG